MEDTAAVEDDVDVAIAALRGAIAAHESATPEPADVDTEVLRDPDAEQPPASPGASIQAPGQQRSAAASPVPDFVLAPPPPPPEDRDDDDVSDISGSESSPEADTTEVTTDVAMAAAASKPPSPVPDFVHSSPPPPPPPPGTDDSDSGSSGSDSDGSRTGDDGEDGTAAAVGKTAPRWSRQFQEQRQEAERQEEDWRARAAQKLKRQQRAIRATGEYGYGDRFVLSYESEVTYWNPAIIFVEGRRVGGRGGVVHKPESEQPPCTLSSSGHCFSLPRRA